MPEYIVEQYEIFSQKYAVTADSPAEAIKRTCDGEGRAIDNSLEFIENHEDMGMPASQSLLTGLQNFGIYVALQEPVPSIRSVEEVDETSSEAE